MSFLFSLRGPIDHFNACLANIVIPIATSGAGPAVVMQNLETGAA